MSNPGVGPEDWFEDDEDDETTAPEWEDTDEAVDDDAEDPRDDIQP